MYRLLQASLFMKLLNKEEQNKMKKISLLIVLLSMGQMAFAQNWLAQAKKAVFSVVTYDKEGNILNNGNGFFISNDGVALSDYNLFKNAEKAVIIDADGQKSEVSYILGANDMYDAVKFKVNTSKKITPLTLAKSKANVGQNVYVIPYSTQKTVIPIKSKITNASDVASEYKFYSMPTKLEDNNVSCPILNEQGQVVGVAQKGTETECYGLDSQFSNNLAITALSLNDYALNSIKIMKDLPTSSDDALVYVLMSGNEENNVNRLVEKFPDLAEGYLRRATNNVNKSLFEAAESDLKTYYDKAEDKAEASYQISKLIYNLNLFQPDLNKENWSFNKALEEADKSVVNDNVFLYKKHKGDVLFATKNYQAAYDQFASLLNTEMNKSEVYSYMADCKIQLESPEEEVIALLDSAVAQFSKPYPNEAAPYLYLRAQHKSNAKKYREAISDYNDVEHIYGGRANAEFYYNREFAEKSCRMYQQASNDIEEALTLAPENYDILVEHASLNIMLKDFEKSQATAEKLITLFPEDAIGYRFKGFCQAMNGKKAEAKTNLEKAKSLGDENAESIIEKYCK